MLLYALFEYGLTIEQGRVSSIYAFDRTRLFRNYYDGMEFQDLCRKHDTNLVYTSSGQGHVQATDSTFLEGVLLMFSNIEGKNIARRNGEVQRRCPPRKLGYTKISEPTKQYVKHPDKQAIVQACFSALQEVHTIEDVSRTLKRFRKQLTCTDEQLIRVAQDPFYAGYDLYQGESRLSYVEPYMSLEQFKNLQVTVGPLLESYSNRVNLLKQQYVITPLCGYCRQPLRYRIDKVHNTAYYSCSFKHEKLCISMEDIQKIVKLVLGEIMNKLDEKRMLRQSQLQMKHIRQTIEKELQTIEHELTEIRQHLLYQEEYHSDWGQHPKYKKMTQLKEEKYTLLRELDAREQVLQENKEIVAQMEAYFSGHIEENASLLALMFIENIIVYHDTLDFEVAKFDYLQNLSEDLTYYAGGDAI